MSISKIFIPFVILFFLIIQKNYAGDCVACGYESVAYDDNDYYLKKSFCLWDKSKTYGICKGGSISYDQPSSLGQPCGENCKLEGQCGQTSFSSIVRWRRSS